MSSTINAVTTSGGGVAITPDSSGILQLQTAGTTALSISAAQAVTLTNALPIGSGGTGLTTSGAAGNVLTSDGTNWVSSSKITSMTVNNGGTTPFPSTGGPLVVDFTGIPSWVKRITVMFNGVSLSGTSNFLVQLGSGGITTTGYTSSSGAAANASNVAIITSTSGFIVSVNSAARTMNGIMTITNINSNSWVEAGNLNASDIIGNTTGIVSLSGTLDRIRITTVNGTDTFDAGSINILYE